MFSSRARPLPLSTRSFWLAALLVWPAIAAAEPPPGHPSAAEAGMILGLPGTLPAEALPHAGVVMRAIDSNAFTYIEVQEDRTGDRRWIAAPRIPLAPGTRIRFDDGRLMNDFYSRKHGITFSSITFVNQAVPVSPPAR